MPNRCLEGNCPFLTPQRLASAWFFLKTISLLPGHPLGDSGITGARIDQLMKEASKFYFAIGARRSRRRTSQRRLHRPFGVPEAAESPRSNQTRETGIDFQQVHSTSALTKLNIGNVLQVARSCEFERIAGYYRILRRLREA